MNYNDDSNDLITRIFCDVDDFCFYFKPHFLKNHIECKEKKRNKPCALTESEIITITVYFQFSGYRNFKTYYHKFVLKNLKSAFPKLLSYNRFVELKKTIIPYLFAFINKCRLGTISGISFIDSTKLRVCDNLRIYCHETFEGLAQRGKTSTGWFYGFKLHLIINDKGELLSYAVTSRNVDNKNYRLIKYLTKNLFGKMFGDKGYISSKLFEKLFNSRIELITKTKKNMKNKLMDCFDKVMLRKRALIETVNDELKNICYIEHTRHRSFYNFMVNIFSSLIAYTYFPKKPSINLDCNFNLPIVV